MRSTLLGHRYRLGPVIGIGGMGAVHRARDERLERDVAVKVLPAGAAAVDCERLRREVEYLGSVQHPNLVEMLDGGADGGQEAGGGVTWFAMELVAGPDLRTLLDERGPLEGEAVRRLLVGVLGALTAMHAVGLVHRDVTPANILLTAHPFGPWEAKLADLGVARRALAVPLTDAGRVVGTAAYLSPEQVVGGDVGPATDVYSLALVAVEALTGLTPFPGSAVESATCRLLRPPALPANLAPEWREVLLAATATDAADRPDVAALLAAVVALPEDAGVRPDRRAVRDTRAALRAADRAVDASAGAAPTAAMAVRVDHSTAVLPAAGAARDARTTEIAVQQQPRPRSRIAVAVAASAAVFAAIAIVGSAAVVGSHMLGVASVTGGADVATTRPSASASAQPDASAHAGSAAQAKTAQADTAQSGTGTQGDAAQGSAPQAGAGPQADAAQAGTAQTGDAAAPGPADQAGQGTAADEAGQGTAAGPGGGPGAAGSGGPGAAAGPAGGGGPAAP